MAPEPDTDDSSFKSTTTEEESITTTDSDDEGSCSLCGSHDRIMTQIGDCADLKVIRVYIENHSETVKTVAVTCQTCLYKLYTIIDQNRIKAYNHERRNRLTAVAALITSTGAKAPEPSPMPDTDPESDNGMEESSGPEITGVAGNVDQSFVHRGKDWDKFFYIKRRFPMRLDEGAQKPKGKQDLKDTDVKNSTDGKNATEVKNTTDVKKPNDSVPANEPKKSALPQEVATVSAKKCVDGSEQQNNSVAVEPARPLDPQLELDPNQNAEVGSNASSAHAHLDIMYVRTESALITESGGNPDQYKNPPLQCRYCPKVFVLLKPFNKHMRGHESKLSARSASSSRARSGYSTPTNKIYECTDCSATFDSAVKLRRHCRIHLKRYYCTYCHKESFSLFDHEFHEAQCRGGHMAREETTSTRRITRSIAKSGRTAQTARSTRARSNSRASKPSKSSRTFSNLRSRRASTRGTGANEDDEDGDDEDDDDDEDCATSVACTDITGVTSYIEKWVAGTCEEYEDPPAALVRTADQEDEEPTVVSQKEYDMVMLERLLIEAARNVYTCTFGKCDYVTNTLRDMCLHQIVIHKCKSSFYCRDCRGVFTSRLFCDYHIYTQRSAPYRCHRCKESFKYENKLQLHLEQHKRCEAFPCLYCGDSFLTASDLEAHSDHTKHDPKKRKHIVTIDRSMTITNETTSSEPPPPKREYKCTMNIMNLPHQPTKTPLHIIWPKGRSIFLGDIDFEYRPRWHCILTR